MLLSDASKAILWIVLEEEGPFTISLYLRYMWVYEIYEIDLYLVSISSPRCKTLFCDAWATIL